MKSAVANLPDRFAERTAQWQYMRHRVVRKVQDKTHYLAMASMFCGLLGFPNPWMTMDNTLWVEQLFTYLTFILISYILLLDNGREKLAMLTISMVAVCLFVLQLSPFANNFNHLASVLRHHPASGLLYSSTSSEYAASAVLACLVAFAYLFQRSRFLVMSQALLCFAILIPFIPLLGLLCGVDQPYGSMSLLATYSGLMCACGLLARQASHPPLSYILLMDGTGHRIRISILMLGLVAFLLARVTMLMSKEFHYLPILMVLTLAVIIYTMAITYYQHGSASQEVILPPADMDFASQVENALAKHQFYLVYQPQMDFQTGKMKGVEVLIRWLHPSRKTVFPNEFIRVAELTGLIVPIGKWVLQTACKQMAAWQQEPTLAKLECAVNVSSLQLKSPHFVEDVLEILHDTGFPAHQLVLEITESAFVEDDGETARILQRLKQAGIKLAIDDFGTGYSCLAYLRDIPADYLKIDRSFVLDLPGHNRAEAVIQAIVSLGKSLDYRIIAEGVESQAQAAFLKTMGCDIIQGYLYAEPIEASALVDWSHEQSVGKSGLTPQLA